MAKISRESPVAQQSSMPPLYKRAGAVTLIAFAVFQISNLIMPRTLRKDISGTVVTLYVLYWAAEAICWLFRNSSEFHGGQARTRGDAGSQHFHYHPETNPRSPSPPPPTTTTSQRSESDFEQHRSQRSDLSSQPAFTSTDQIGVQRQRQRAPTDFQQPTYQTYTPVPSTPTPQPASLPTFTSAVSGVQHQHRRF
ncbi:MAG: hypothetical protein H7A40_02680 [Chlamydiales bacterium]|nr:hypothetical protein [Chlamydiales bacterium]